MAITLPTVPQTVVSQTVPASILAVGRAWLRSTSRQTLIALVLYLSLAIGFFGLHVVLHLGSECVCKGGARSDPGAYMWFLAWWPHALLSGRNPFVTEALFAPGQLNLGAVTLVPGAAIVAAPITLLFGPLVSFNLLALAAPVLAAYFAFLLCRYVSRSFGGALVGGYVFGFSTYMLGHMLGHLDLVQTFPIPAAVHLTLRLIDNRVSQRKFIVAMALVLATLFLCSPELAFTFAIMGVAAFAIAFVLVSASRPRLTAVIAPTLLAGVVAAVVTSPFIYYALTGPVMGNLFRNYGDIYGADGLGFMVPTALTRLGRGWFSGLAVTFSGNLAEDGVYTGLPLAIIVARYGATRWRSEATRALLAMLALVVLLMLGAHLHIAGHPTLPLPWSWIDRLPLLDKVVPVRLGVYMFLIIALIAALWLAQPRDGASGVAKWFIAGLAVVLLVPNVGSGQWRSRVHNPVLFTTDEYRRVLRDGEIVLALPYPPLGDSMLWQANTGMRFRMAGGYLGPLWRPDYILPAFVDAQITPDPAQIRAFLTRRRVGAVIVDPTDPQQWPGTLAKLGLRPLSLGGVTVYKVPGVR